jgi:hypothetical protein
MSNTIHRKENNINSVQKPTNRLKNARLKLETTKQIADAIRSQPTKDEKNSNLFNL